MDYKAEIKNRKYLQILDQLTRQEGFNNICFHGGLECSKDIINAHTIQKERYLRRISSNGKVKCLRFENFKPVFNDVGLATATTVKGFCSHHDNNLFKPIEEYDYCLYNKEQEFLFVYKAFAKKYYDLRENYYHYTALRRLYETKNLDEIIEVLEIKNIDKTDISRKILNDILPHLKATKYELDINERVRKSLTSRLDKKQYFVINTHRIELNNAYGIVCSDYVYINDNIDGKVINTLKCQEPLYPSFLTIFPQENKTVILLSNIKRDDHIFKELLLYIKYLSENELKILFSNIILRACETVCFSPKLWQLYGENKQNYFTNIYQEQNKYYNLISKMNSEINLFIEK